MRSLAPIKLPGFSHLAGAYAANESATGSARSLWRCSSTTDRSLRGRAVPGMRFAPGFLGQVLVARVEPAGTKRMLPLLYLAEAATFVALAATADNSPFWLVVLLAAVDGTLAIRGPCADARLGGGGAEATWVAARGQRDHQRRVHGRRGIGPLLAGVGRHVGIETALLLDAASFVLVAAMLAAATSLPQVKAQPERWWARLGRGSPT